MAAWIKAKDNARLAISKESNKDRHEMLKKFFDFGGGLELKYVYRQRIAFDQRTLLFALEKIFRFN